MKRSEIITSQTTTTKRCWWEKSRWWRTSSYVQAGNFQEILHRTVPHLKQNLISICKHSTRKMMSETPVAFAKHPHLQGLPRSPVKSVFHICIRMFISSSWIGRTGKSRFWMKNHAWLSCSCQHWSVFCNLRAFSPTFFWLFPLPCWILEATRPLRLETSNLHPG